MTGKQSIIYAAGIAFLAAVVTLITWPMNGWPTACGGGLTWVCFVAWASYFLLGGSVKAATIAYGSVFAGVVGGALMFELSLAFGFTPWWAVPLGVFIVVIPCMYADRVKPISNVAMIFMGIAVYFGLSASGCFAGTFDIKDYALVGLTEMIYVGIGFVFGWISIWYTGLVQKIK